MTVALRLPGITVEAAPPDRPAALPPMDIAAFAGFAARGPCHRAVAVDSVAAFTAVFGGELPLARGRHGAPDLRAHLPSTVRGFFANGGRKCWVVRLARTAQSEACWQARRGGAANEVAEVNTFPVPGILQSLPTSGAPGPRSRPAWLAAASVGSWSDAAELRARVTYTPLSIAQPHAIAKGLRFADPGGLEPGALIEFASADGATRAYARVAGRKGGDWRAIWCGGFERLDDLHGPAAGQARPTVGTAGAATLTPGAISEIAFAVPPATIAPGSWVEFLGPASQVVWLLCQTYAAGVASGPAWRELPNLLPPPQFLARRVRIDLRSDLAGEREELAGLEPGTTGPAGLAALVADDVWYAPADRRRAIGRGRFALRGEDRALVPPEDAPAAWTDAAARYVAGQPDPAGRDLLSAAFLPLGLDTAYGPAGGALPSEALAQARDGLARFDETLFLDPDFAELSADRIGVAVTQQRDLTERALFGLHALYDTPDAGFGLPTILAAPDMVQPGWEALTESGTPGDPSAPASVPANWRNHAGGCPSGESDPIAEPDFSKFLDATTRLLPAPTLSGPVVPVRGDAFTLHWQVGEPGMTVVIEESGSAEFVGAAEVYRGTAAQLDLSGRGEGVRYYRARVDDGSNVSAWSVISVVVRRADFVALEPDLARLQRLHLATMRAAAGAQHLFALLSLPDRLELPEAVEYAAGLTRLSGVLASADQLGPQEQRVTSYAALYHGWLLYRSPPGASAVLWMTPPEGCLAGQMAEIARTAGAWIAPANRPVSDAVGVNPGFASSDRRRLQGVRVNALAAHSLGFGAADAMTLSDEPEWGQINVRRLMTLLRLTALRRGEPLVFEPNGPAVRRALEREFSQMLADFQRRGAFVGGTRGWRLAVQDSGADRDGGKLVAEIGVSPAHPLRFLTFRLVQRGARLTMAEAA